MILALVFCGVAGQARADDRLVRLAVPDRLIDSGLMKYMLPRFSLKTQVKVRIVPPGAPAEAALGAEGVAVFVGEGATWHLLVLAPQHPGTVRFSDWITSEVGQRAITGFQRDGAQVFSLPTAQEKTVATAVFEGDAIEGRRLSRALCGRCHVSVSGEPMIGIGSTPSFFVLRALQDWDERFQTFYVRKPHPAFTQIAGLTVPFPESLPPPIVPVNMTTGDLDAILAYVSALEPADLGAPLKHQ